MAMSNEEFQAATDAISKGIDKMYWELRFLREIVLGIQGALGTKETGEALITVARNAHKAEQELAAIKNNGFIDIVFDGPPSNIAPSFVEVENNKGEGMSVGEWTKRDDKFWVLRIKGFIK